MNTAILENTNGSAISDDIKRLLLDGDSAFWTELAERTKSATSFNELVFLSRMRKKAVSVKLNGAAPNGRPPLKIALIGGSTLYPLSELLEHVANTTIGHVEIKTGDFNNYRSEILDPASELYQFQPNFVVLLPDEQSCKYSGELSDPRETVASEIERIASELFQLCSIVKERAGAEVILCNFILPAYFDLGPYRAKSPASDWNFRKAVNLELGSKAPSFVHICDLEFLAYRLGGLTARDERTWFESKQLCSPPLQVALAKEIAHLIDSVKRSPKKVLVLDLDNTLWGGVVGDEGVEGIEIGDTSPRGEAFKAFQAYILSLTQRGLLLGVCSKNDFENAIEPFRRHPEMVLKEEHFVSFKANWNPKAQNLIEMAEELNLGLDSFIFVDDNPAEVENVRQFAPEVTSIVLDPDPSAFVRQLQESRLFERTTITAEDLQRTTQYRTESERRSAMAASVDMESYLESLDMVGTIRDFDPIDLPRITQLLNKSNQFNLTTRRRTEAELAILASDPEYICFAMRLADKFGDHGLISIVICCQNEGVLEIDTWLMSCRVLKRQVEDQMLNEIFDRARARGCNRVRGVYFPTAKNSMVKDHYSRCSFEKEDETDEFSSYTLSVENFSPRSTFIKKQGT